MLGMMSLTVNRLIRRKLRLSLILLVAYVAVDLAIGALRPSLLAGDARHSSHAFAQARARRRADQRGGLPPRQSAARRSRARAVPDHPAGRHRHRADPARVDVPQPAARHDLRGQRGRPRLRAAGHARQRLRRPRDPEREAVPRRALGEGRGPRRARRRSHLARHQAADEGRQLRHPAEQRRREGSRSSTTPSRRRRSASRSRSARRTWCRPTR